MSKASFTPAAQAYRFYNDDGSESTSTPYAGVAESTNITVNNASNAQFHLRWRVQETGGADGATTDDWGLQYQVNGTGGWTSITASSSRVRAYTSSGLTADGATTNRATNGISDGTGSFVAGEQEETNGVIEDCQLTTNNFTEHVWALELVAADNSNGETLHFRMTLNGGSPGMTNSSTPIVTISKPVANTLDAQPGTFTLTFPATANNVGRVTNAAAGSFTLTGADVTFTLTKDWTLNAEPATFTISASAVSNVIGMNLNAEAGGFTLTGQDATLPVDRPLNAEPGAFTLTGIDADLTAVVAGGTAYELDASPGSFTLTGADVGLTLERAPPNAQGGGLSRGQAYRKKDVEDASLRLLKQWAQQELAAQIAREDEEIVEIVMLLEAA